jgi:hypothetical protein
MARIIGRKGCPWCGFASAHIKQNEGKHPYHHCPECGTMTPARNGAQARHICADMRPEPDYKAGDYAAASQAVAQAQAMPEPPRAADPIIVPGVVVKSGRKTDKPAATTPPPAGGGGLWGQLMGKGGA